MEAEKVKSLFWRTEYYGALVDGGVASLYMGLVGAMLQLGNKAAFASSGRMKLPSEVPYYFIPHSKFFRNFPELLNMPYNFGSYKKILKIIDKEQPDFLFQHHHDFNFGGAMIKKETGLPFLLHADSVELWIKKNWGKLYLEKLLKIAEEIQWEHADRIFVPSELVKEQISEYGVESSKIIVNPNAVDTSKFNPAIDGANILKKYGIDKKYVCGFVGTFGQWHGVDIIAGAARKIIDEIPDAFIFLVGDGPLRPKVEAILKESGAESKSIITGLVPYEEIPAYMSACDVLLTPCVSNEDDSGFFNSPIKLFEYMAMGKPIVATGIGQQGIIIKHDVNGLICEERNTDSIVNEIKKLYHDRDKAKEIALRARQNAVERHDWKVNANRIVNVYNEVIAEKIK